MAIVSPRLIELDLQTRDKDGNIIIKQEKIPPNNLAIVVMDIWDYHWCRTARERTVALIPRMNYTLDTARQLGITICFSPTGAMRDLWEAPQYQATLALPQHPLPEPKQLNFTPPRWGDCMCGPGYPCLYHSNRNNQHPDLKMCEGDFIVLETQQMYNLCKERGIEHIILIGEHTNMCVLGKPCGVYPLVSRGFKVYLGQDVTDACTGYDPGGSTPDDGTRQVVAQIERDICPSINLEEMLRQANAWKGKPPLDYVHISPWGRKFGDEVTPHSTHIELTLPCLRQTKDAQIRYTLDGSNPTLNAPRYTEPIRFNDSRIVKAAGFKEGQLVTLISQAEFWKMPPIPPLPNVYLSELYPVKEEAGENREDTKVDLSAYGNVLRNRGMKYIKGVGVQAPSELVYALEPQYKRFVVLASVDDEVCQVYWAKGDRSLYKVVNLIFAVYIDGNRVAQSPVMINGEKPWGFDVGIPNDAKQLKLVVRDADNPLADQGGSGDWLHAGFITQ